MDQQQQQHGMPGSPMPADMSGAIRTAFNVLDAWNLRPQQQQVLLGLKPRTYYEWRRKAPSQPDIDKIERVSYILGIYKALGILVPQSRDEWLHMKNLSPEFNGRKPIDVMLSGQVADLYRVRRWLDGWRGWN